MTTGAINDLVTWSERYSVGIPRIMEVMRFLQHWLVDHIVGVDKQYSAHLRAAGVK
jgi:hypothetical protein